MHTVKVVVTGPFNAGKTTFIKTISEISVVSTEKKVSSKEKVIKDETTVAMDFGRVTVTSNVALYLFGTPGQDRFSFMWETLSQGMLGFVVLVDYSTGTTFIDSENILKYFKSISKVPYVVAVTKANGRVTPDIINDVRRKLVLGKEVPLYYCNISNKESVKEVLLGLLYRVLEEVQKRDKVR